MTTRKRLDALLASLVEKKGVRHAVASVATADGFWWSNAAGDADGEGTPMTSATPFHIASIDKLLTATVVMRLHETQQVALDSPLFDYLPQSLVAGIHRIGNTDRSGSITVRHLLAHTSGLPDCFEDRPRGGISRMERLFLEGDQTWTLADLMEDVRDRLAPRFPPQSEGATRQKIRYSDTNYQLLLALIETVTGRPVHEVFDEILFRPLGMRQTWFEGRSLPADPSPPAAAIWFGAKRLDLPLALSVFPSIYSTCRDLTSFMTAFSRGDLFDDPATLETMQRRWNRFGFPLDRAALHAPGWPIEYGLGIMRFRLPIVFSGLRRLPAVTGHTGLTGSWLFFCPELSLVAAGTVDQLTAGAVPYRFVPKLLRVMKNAAALPEE